MGLLLITIFNPVLSIAGCAISSKLSAFCTSSTEAVSSEEDVSVTVSALSEESDDEYDDADNHWLINSRNPIDFGF